MQEYKFPIMYDILNFVFMSRFKVRIEKEEKGGEMESREEEEPRAIHL